MAAALALAAACGGQAFTTTPGDAGVGDATLGDGSGTTSSDGASDVAVDTAGNTADGAPNDAPSDAVAADATSDAVAMSGDGAADAAPGDAFVPDVLEEPPPHCAGAFACVPSVPSGWSGPYEVYAGSTASPSCSANFAGPAYDGNGGLAWKAAACGCSCATATGVSCAAPLLTFYGEATAGTGCSSSSVCTNVGLTPGGCADIDVLPVCPTPAILAAMTAGSSVALTTNASCAPMASQSVTPYAWGISARACLSALPPAQVDCASGSVCAPAPASPFGSQLCISQPGNVACPTAGYTNNQLFYGGVNDQRSCTTCSCGSVSGATCSATVSVSSSTNSTCTGNTISYIAPFSCAAVQQPGDFRLTLTPAGGGCSPSPVSPTGTVAPVRATTFCCLP